MTDIEMVGMLIHELTFFAKVTIDDLYLFQYETGGYCYFTKEGTTLIRMFLDDIQPTRPTHHIPIPQASLITFRGPYETPYVFKRLLTFNDYEWVRISP